MFHCIMTHNEDTHSLLPIPSSPPKESILNPAKKEQKEQRNKITFDTQPRSCYYSTNQIINDVESEEYPAKRVVESWPFCCKANVSAAGEWAEESPGRKQLIVAQVGSPRYRAQVSLSS